jgi:hypothetical protein
MAMMDSAKDDNLALLQDLGRRTGERYFSDQFPRRVFDEDVRL